MTDCSTTRDWIVEADVEELRHGASGEHGGHLAACPVCRALADEILGAEEALDELLGSARPALDVEAALAQAREAHQVARRHRHWQMAVPLSAAALGGLLLLARPSPTPVSEFDPATVAAARTLGLAGRRPLVRADSHESVAVLPTGNPNITVIWFME